MFSLLLALGCSPPVDSASHETAQDSGGDTAVVDDTLRGELQFRFPILQPERMTSLFFIGVDHDAEVHGDQSAVCLNYEGRSFPWCYDEHDGSDFLLDGGFDAMDLESATIIAAADGVVVETEDGNYDHCHASVETADIDCDGHPQKANYVIVQHETGHISMYWHMMTDSVAVSVGDEVRAGDVLGTVGSSGTSSVPHLHFELQDADGVVIDPFAGAYSQEETWWCLQNEPGELPGLCE